MFTDTLLQTILGETQDAVIITDMMGRIVLLNPRAEVLFGYKASAAKNKTINFLFANPICDPSAPQWENNLKREMKCMGKTRDGAEFPVSLTVRSAESRHGASVVFFARDTRTDKEFNDATRELQERYEAAFHTSPEAIILSREADGLCIDINDSFTELTGFTREDTIGKTTVEFGLWDSEEIRTKAIKVDNRRGQTRHDEQDIRTKDGQCLTVAMSIRRIQLNGTPHIITVSRDLSRARKAEIALEQSEARLRAVFDNTPVCLNLKDTEGRYLFINKPYEDWLGLKAADVVGKTAKDFMTEGAEEENLSNAERRVLETGDVVEQEVTVPRNGEPFHRILIKFPIKNPDGSIQSIGTAAVDITEYRKATEAQKRSEAMLRNMIDHVPAVIHFKDLQGRYLYANQAFLEWSGLAEEGFEGKTLDHMNAPDVVARYAHHDKEVITTKKAVKKEWDCTYPDGIRRQTMQIKFPVMGDNGDIIATGGFTIDISAIKKTENELREAKKAAEMANAAKSIFLANMSHELRTPLNSILGFSEMMAREIRGPLEDHYQEYAEIIRSSGAHLLSVVSDVLDMSKIEAGKMDLNEEAVDIQGIVEEAIVLLRETAYTNEVVVTHRFNRVPKLHADPVRLKQIILNILTNAIKFSPHGQVNIIIDEPGEEQGVRLRIVDSGIGMSPEDIKLALVPFGQAEGKAYTRRFEGTGLGLPLAVQLVEMHGGSLQIESKPNKGTTVTIHFPVERCIA